jgi:hypothetical protein
MTVDDVCDRLVEVFRGPRDWVNRPGALRDRLGEAEGVEDCVSRGLRQALDDRDWDMFESYVFAGLQFPSPDHVEPLCTALLLQDDNAPNDDVVELLFDLADPRSISCLEETLRWEPDWDEYRHLAVKAILALANIGTPHAIEVLRDVSSVGPARLREVASSQLDRLS